MSLEIEMVRDERYTLRVFRFSFGQGIAPRLFAKFSRVPITTLRKLNLRVLIYFDDFLILGKTLEETIMSRGTTIFLLRHLSFVTNIKKSTAICKEAGIFMNDNRLCGYEILPVK